MSDHAFGRSGESATPPQALPNPDTDVTRTSTARPVGERLRVAEGVDVTLLDYVRVFYKRRWTAITTMLVVIISVAAYTFAAVPIYQARARLLIEAENPNVVAFKEVIEQDQTRQDYYQTQYNILQSRALARRTLDELKLWNRSPFGGVHATPFSLRTGLFVVVSAIAHAGASGKGASLAAPDADETAAQSRATDEFLSNLTVTPVRNSRLVDVKYELSDPTLATHIVNTLVKNYIDQSLEHRFTASKEAGDWLELRLAEQRKQVGEAEAKLQVYREQNDGISLQERSNIVVQKLTELNAAVTQAKTSRLQKEASYQQLESLLATPSAVDTFPAILSNTFFQQQKSELAQLQTQYAQSGEKLGLNHPDMVKLRSAIQMSQAKLDTEIAKIVHGLKNEYQAALATEQSLTASLNAQKAAAQAMNRKAIDASVLERDVQSSRQVYDGLLQRAKETGVSGELKTSNIRVVDQAERPLTPVSPQPWFNLILASLGGGLLACGLVCLFECLDNRIKSPDEIRTYLGLSELGMLPKIHHHGTPPTFPLVNNGVPPNFSEAFRAIRTNVLFSSPQEHTRSLVVTSTGAREGKSMVASNLAISFAQIGKRVLLIDADMRKPKAHEIFEIDQEPGLSNLLVGHTKASEAVRKTSVAGLWVLPAGRLPPNPAELVGSQSFKNFVLSLNGHFDWVVIDSPPVMAVTDASLIAHTTSVVLFVISAELTSRHAARRALDQLAHAEAKFAGAVLNNVDLERHPYYYSVYYRPEYGDYYNSQPV
jgi:succinoglycan biosynthesis transport protein ExoP